jgi:hypothetical protein
MTLDKLKEALKDNKISYSSVPTSELYNIFRFASVNLEMDNKTLDYYYEINAEELGNSELPDEELETLKIQGWAFDKSNRFLVLYLKN